MIIKNPGKSVKILSDSIVGNSEYSGLGYTIYPEDSYDTVAYLESLKLITVSKDEEVLGVYNMDHTISVEFLEDDEYDD